MGKLIGFYVKIAVITIGLILSLSPYMVDFEKPKKAREIIPLSIDEQQYLFDQLGKHGFRRLVKIKCYDALVIKIRTGKWDDAFCAKTYGHLDFTAFGEVVYYE